MAWDDFLGSVQDFTQSDTFQTVSQYIQDNPSTLQLVKNAISPPAGNQSAAQIAAGQAGAPRPIAAPASGGLQASLSGAFSPTGKKYFGMSIGMLAIIGIGAYLVLHKKGRK